MKSRICPARKHCWDRGSCEECGFHKAIENLNTKIKNLKKRNKFLVEENERLNEQIESCRHDF